MQLASHRGILPAQLPRTPLPKPIMQTCKHRLRWDYLLRADVSPSEKLPLSSVRAQLHPRLVIGYGFIIKLVK